MRQEFARRTRALAFRRANGCCEGNSCGAKLSVGKIHYDHVIPDQMGGDNSLNNCQVLCIPCHVDKTRKDVGDIAKSNRVLAKHIGIKPKTKGRPMPGTRASGLRKRMNGNIEHW